ncbi:hypothetical protein CI109_107160 [Kwoniella shandongensis]|uniref:NADP-dependent oxidoreductase domain-containing protein n=1 Tax=Kwoniella shandongensis TaxID=1734106 RepID=A0A5M6C5Q4_9TREE|nr:uncharacterized protein CI109_002443 [Kwoniella shandongensis]KAA5529102.1 hypothetical protein CI109_002443 [Kwoniella shandongensis]
MSSIPTITVAGKQVGRVGYGLMQLSTDSANASNEQGSLAAMKAAADAGATCWSSASFYGPDYANIRLIAKFFAKYPEYKEKIVLVIKGGYDASTFSSRGKDIGHVRREIKEMQAILGDKSIDIFLLARLESSDAVEESFQNLVTLQKEGLFNEIGASEISAASLERASKITPISLIENEISLFAYSSEIRKVIAWSETHSVPIFAYSPLGRGMLTGALKKVDDIAEGNMLRMFPQFQGEAFESNVRLVEKLEEIAKSKGIQTGELALAWLTQLSDFIIPIPGSSKTSRVISNTQAINIKLSTSELAEIQTFLDTEGVKGDRYPGVFQKELMV